MISKTSTLEDVCFEVTEALDLHGFTAVLTGGSAASMYAPNAYMSQDADFVLQPMYHSLRWPKRFLQSDSYVMAAQKSSCMQKTHSPWNCRADHSRSAAITCARHSSSKEARAVYER